MLAAVAGAQRRRAASGRPRPRRCALTLDEAVRRAVENNPELAIVRLGTEVEAARVGESRGAFTPVFSTSLGPVEQRDAAVESRCSASAASTSTTGSRPPACGSGCRGARARGACRGTRRGRRTNNPISSFDPSLQSGLPGRVLAAAAQGSRDRRRAASVHRSRSGTRRAPSCASARRSCRRWPPSSRRTGR